jgi:predicted secreted protein
MAAFSSDGGSFSFADDGCFRGLQAARLALVGASLMVAVT